MRKLTNLKTRQTINKARTNLLIFVDDELRKKKTISLSIGQQKTDDFYVYFEDSFSNKSEIYSVKSSTNQHKLFLSPPINYQISNSMKLIENSKTTTLTLSKDLNIKENKETLIFKTPKLLRKDFTKKLISQSEEVYSSYRKLRMIANFLKKDLKSKSAKLTSKIFFEKENFKNSVVVVSAYNSIISTNLSMSSTSSHTEDLFELQNENYCIKLHKCEGEIEAGIKGFEDKSKIRKENIFEIQLKKCF